MVCYRVNLTLKFISLNSCRIEFIGRTDVIRAISYLRLWSSRLLLAEAWDQSQGSPCGTWTGRSDTGLDCTLSIQVSPCQSELYH